jgi:hypothetical protein
MGTTISNQEFAKLLTEQCKGSCHSCMSEYSCDKDKTCEQNVYEWLVGIEKMQKEKPEIDIDVVLYDGDKKIKITVKSKSANDCANLLKDFFGNYLPAYDMFYNGENVRQYNGQNKH